MKVSELMTIMEDIAPAHLAEEWDHVGLQVGDLNQETERIMIALDADPRVIEEAVSKRIDLIITHHPLFFRPVQKLLFHQPLGKIVSLLIKNDIALFSAHTNLDIAVGGINDYLAELLDLRDVAVLAETKEEALLKLVVFVPVDYLDQVRNAISEAGAGHIGSYSHCTFAAPGEGTFVPLPGTNPFVGKLGQLEKTPEYRLETIVPASVLNQVIAAMISSHPYEEVAYDLYQTALPGAADGLGRVGSLSQQMTLNQLVHKVKKLLAVEGLRVVGEGEKQISCVAVCGGSGMSLLKEAQHKGAQCLLTSDMKYHEAQEALEKGIAVIDADHFATEGIFISRLASLLKNRISKAEITILTSEINTNPWRFY
ncbi:Nif3-like dinuclear metal center hexameric protein [Dehalobacterium formicoaceticum]|uniref:Nif3-like dinuclear metal center hexameric protein n=1 Tax=Dehalobacterium formicoaceticum TaxID=51515 RepID=UPI0031F6F3DC